MVWDLVLQNGNIFTTKVMPFSNDYENPTNIGASARSK